MKTHGRGTAAALALVVGSLGGLVSFSTESPATAATTDDLLTSVTDPNDDEAVVATAVDESPMVQALANTDNLTDQGITQALQAAGASQIHIESDPLAGTAADDGQVVSARGGMLPPDLFSVRGSWADYVSNGKVFVAFYGRWNYDNKYIGSGAPYDAAGLVLSGFNKNCWTNVSTGLRTQDQDGTITHLESLRAAYTQRSVWDVHDRTSGFQLLTDMGFGWIEMRRDRAGCDSRKIGRFYHEHNQGGGGTWSFSITVGAFQLGYTGDPGMTLQKATPVKYFDKY